METANLSPEGYSTVCPCLSVESVEAQMEFMVKVLQASIKEDSKGEGDFIQHGEVLIGESTIMISRASKQWPVHHSSIFVYVKNADEVYNRALQHNATPLMPPEDRPYGIRDGGFKDPSGNEWWVGQLIGQLHK